MIYKTIVEIKDKSINIVGNFKYKIKLYTRILWIFLAFCFCSHLRCSILNEKVALWKWQLSKKLKLIGSTSIWYHFIRKSDCTFYTYHMYTRHLDIYNSANPMPNSINISIYECEYVNTSGGQMMCHNDCMKNERKDVVCLLFLNRVKIYGI